MCFTNGALCMAWGHSKAVACRAPFRVFDGRVLRGGFHCLACVMQEKRKSKGKYSHLFLSLCCLSLYLTTCTHCLYPAPPFPSSPPFHTTHAARQTREMRTPFRCTLGLTMVRIDNKKRTNSTMHCNAIQHKTRWRLLCIFCFSLSVIYPHD